MIEEGHKFQRMFAIAREGGSPGIMVLAKGLTGRYLPRVVPLISAKLFSAFDGPIAKGRSTRFRPALKRRYKSYAQEITP
jgi:hypothetical protein